jgi:hypothetical protein
MLDNNPAEKAHSANDTGPSPCHLPPSGRCSSSESVLPGDLLQPIPEADSLVSFCHLSRVSTVAVDHVARPCAAHALDSSSLPSKRQPEFTSRGLRKRPRFGGFANEHGHLASQPSAPLLRFFRPSSSQPLRIHPLAVHSRPGCALHPPVRR